MNQRTAYVNLEAEQAVLGAALQDDRSAKLTAEMVTEDFYEPAHQVIQTAIKEMVASKEPVDLVTIHQKLTAANRINLIGGDQYLMRIMSSVITTVNVKSYIDIVRECASRRRLKAIGQMLTAASGDMEKTVDEIREDAALKVKDVKSGETVRLITQMDALVQTYEKISDAQRREGEPEKNRIMTGIPRLDKLTGGLYGSKMVVIGARPSVGKSVFALTICMNAAKHGKRVLFISLEMEEDEIIQRELASDSMVPLTEITSDEVKVESWGKLAESLGCLGPMPISYCTEAFTVEQVRKAAFQMYENGGLDLICVDYLQLMSTVRNKSNRNEEVSEISRGLKRLAQEMKIPILALSQLNRQSEKSYGGKKLKRAPTMSEARESGAIEQDANVFILLHDPSIDELQTDEERRQYKALKDHGMKLIHVNVDKNRQGKKGWFYLAFDGDHMRFLPIAKEESP